MKNFELPLTLKGLLDVKIQNLISTESAMMFCLPTLIDNGLSKELDLILLDYLDLSKVHIEKLNRIAAGEGTPLTDFKNELVLHLVEQSKAMIVHCATHEIKEICLLAFVQKINHLKISGFNTVSALAKKLNRPTLAITIHEMAEDEKDFEKGFLHISKGVDSEKAPS